MNDDRMIDLSALPHYLPSTKRCHACGSAIRRLTPAVMLGSDGGWVHERCVGKALLPVTDLRPVKVHTKLSGMRSATNTAFLRQKRRLFDARRAAGDWSCSWCGRETSELLPKNHPLKAVADHTYGLANDPSSEFLCLSCADCNRSRSDKPGPPPWLAGWTPGAPLPETPSARVARERVERERRRELNRGRDRRPWMRTGDE